MSNWTEQDDALLNREYRAFFGGKPAEQPDTVPSFIYMTLVRAYERLADDRCTVGRAMRTWRRRFWVTAGLAVALAVVAICR